jgi:hypothetical protein
MFEDSRYDDGDTGVHEVGHFMGLYHTFHGLNCSGAGDYVDDTPFHNQPNYDCNYYDTCPSQWGSDPIYNFMNYTPDPCMYEFTTGQRARIDWAMATYKPSMSALYVTLIGDTYLPTGMTGYWTASVTGGNGTFNYKWYYRPISSSYTLVRDVTSSERSDSYSRSAGTEDFYIRVDVASGSEFDSDEIFVDVCAGPNCPLGPVSASQTDEGTKVAAISETVPERYALAQNYPNPFNPQTEIRFALPEVAHVSITVYDALGREVACLIDRTLQAGYHRITFDGKHLPSGAYVYRFMAGNYFEAKRMILTK